jgi:mannose-6-phosphate isomerase
VSLRRLESTALEKVWGTPDTEPWYPRSERKIGEVWFTAPEEPRLLVKFVFTSASLSVQVHPPDSPSGLGKTEMWHILRAAPGARLALGFEHPASRDQVREAAISGEIEQLLRWYPAHPGDTFFVPAGTVHAIGGGLALCEIQQNSDVTYRLYDYGRPRELHLDESLRVADLGWYTGPEVPAGCPYFRTESIATAAPVAYEAGPHAEFLICLEGEGLFGTEPFAPGQVWIASAGTMCAIQPLGQVRLLRTHVPPAAPV